MTTNVPIPPPPPPEPDEGGGRRRRPLLIVVAVVVIVGVLALTEWGRDAVLPFLLGLAISLAAILAIPSFVGAIRAAGHPPGARRHRFWKGFGVTLGIEIAIAVISTGTCLVLFNLNRSGQ